ncbi:protein TIFY 10b [Cryptomeria japonica]|uniref:protein TIFY 10b n=1 Tax=Cryptomeria japonica TaxID=3369 RepID=UPI0027D9F7F6|nr:protein TIFY 10b [Cryptomeria japonica]
MSQSQLFTIDFLGIASDENGSPQLDSTMDCPKQLVHSRSTQSYLGKIKPFMLQQVLSHGCLSDSKKIHREGQIRVCEGIKTLDLFPQHPLGFQSSSKQDNSQSGLLDTQIEIPEAVPANPSSTQLTILYNYPRHSVSNSQESTQGGKQRHAVETSNANLPLAKRLSLQRFLQKRKDRLSRVIPYVTSSE